MTVKEVVIITIYGNNGRTQEAARQISDYALSLPGVAVKADEMKEQKKYG